MSKQAAANCRREEGLTKALCLCVGRRGGHVKYGTNQHERPLSLPTCPAATSPSCALKMPIKAPRNENFGKLSAGYLFPVIGKKKTEFMAANPGSQRSLVFFTAR
eukprot:1618458-Rhodomonas_salina.3